MTLKSEPVRGRPVGAFMGEAAGESQPRRQLISQGRTFEKSSVDLKIVRTGGLPIALQEPS
jgi:hypothetical protein